MPCSPSWVETLDFFAMAHYRTRIVAGIAKRHIIACESSLVLRKGTLSPLNRVLALRKGT
jgi:hypothetical protein